MKNLHFKIFLLLFPIILFLSFNKHSKDKSNSYHGLIWADAAGYYVYQPIWFIYGNNANSFPDSIDVKTGYGFSQNKINNKVITKYTSGVAILETPFFLISHFLSKPLGFKNDGFSKIYSYGLYFSGVFYCCFALFLLSRFLMRHFSLAVSIIAPVVILTGTNLYYYTIDAPGMSHVYSFFLFSLIIYLTPFLISSFKFSSVFLFASCLVLVILTRPTSILIGLFPLFYGVSDKIEFGQRITLFFQHKLKLIIAFLLSSIILIPQLLYWKSNSGNFLIDSYTNEHFTFLKSPKLIQVWFSANNGLFTYTPLIIIFLIGILFMMKNKSWLGSFSGVLFLVMSYIFASWWNWWFGCSFGARSFVEYYALLIIPFCYLLEYKKHKASQYLLYFCILLCCFWNLDIEYYYDGCFYGDTWDFTAFFKLLKS